MNVKELIEKLQDYDQNMEVFLSGDSEGNYFFNVDCFEKAEYDNKESLVLYPTHDEVILDVHF